MTKLIHHPRRRRYALQALLGSGAIALGVCAVVLSQDAVSTPVLAQAQEQAAERPNQVDAQTYHAVQRLRKEISLTSSDLRALGCDVQTASSCISSTLEWYKNNGVTLHQARNKVLSAKEALYEAHRSSKTTEVELRRLAEELVQAKQELEAVHDMAAAGAERSMSADQRDFWRACRKNRDVPGLVRYVSDLTDEQKAKSVEVSGKPVDQIVRDLGLGYRQEQALRSVQASLSSVDASVSLAEATVLPLPEEIRLENEATYELADEIGEGQ